jgi:hypothetical protein
MITPTSLNQLEKGTIFTWYDNSRWQVVGVNGGFAEDGKFVVLSVAARFLNKVVGLEGMECNFYPSDLPRMRIEEEDHGMEVI